jgi:SAM-dependent methyltransferase
MISLSNPPGGQTARETGPSQHVTARGIQWLSSERPENTTALAELQERMAAFYAETRSYYAEIDFTAGAWQSDPCYLRILREVRAGSAVLEVGCGRANVLSTCPDLASRYTGVDFSRELLLENSSRFPSARFVPVTSPQKLPFGDAMFDRVFCMYVLEHCVFPRLFLHECLRVVRPGGLFLLLCPNFLGQGQMPSQRAGSSMGNGRDKLRRGQLVDALTTGHDRKIRIPWAAFKARRAARAGRGGFWINTAPTCFADPFYVDADAVYLTYEWEILQELRHAGADIADIGAEEARIFVSARRKTSTARTSR